MGRSIRSLRNRRKKLHKIIRPKTGPPPSTKRFCVQCNKVAQFTYNRTIGHSECQYCGGRYGKPLNKNWKNAKQRRNERRENVKKSNRRTSKKVE